MTRTQYSANVAVLDRLRTTLGQNGVALAIVLVVISIMEVLQVLGIEIPNPMSIILVGITLLTVLGNWRHGLVGAIAAAGLLVQDLIDNDFHIFSYDGFRFFLFVIFVPVVIWAVSVLHQKVSGAEDQASRVKNKLRETTSRYQRIVENAQFGVYVVDSQGSIKFANAKAHAALGCTSLVAKKFLDLVGPDYRERILATLVGRDDRDPSQPLPAIQMIGGTRAPQWVIVDIHPADESSTDSIIIVNDVADNRSLEAELKLSEQQLRWTFAQAGVGIAHVSPDGRWLRINDRVSDMLGWSREELLSKSFQEVTHPDDLNADLEQVQKMLRGEIQSYSMEKRYIRKDGSIFWADLTVSLVSEVTGEPKFFISVVQDISTKKMLEERLLRANDRLEARVRERTVELTQANRVKSEFLATVSHELRTPLNGVLGMSELLLGTELEGKQREYAEGIRTSADILRSVINDVLDFSKIEAGKVELEHIEYAWSQILGDIRNLFRYQALTKGLDFQVVSDVDPSEDIVICDPSRLRQIASNLVGNAIKFTSCGYVQVRLSVVSRGSLTKYRFEVSDTGHGVPEDALEKIFAPFGQADSSMTRRFGGTGLGLTISKELVELMGGAIHVRSKPGLGAIFWFEVELSVAHATKFAAPTLTKVAKVYSSAGRVLVVEDNLINQKIAIRLLEKIGLEARGVDSGRAALDAISDHAWDLVLMDCQMPDMDGFEVTGAIRRFSESSKASVPIVAMTANVLKGDRERCLASGMNDYIGKPIDQSRLSAVISKWLPLASHVDFVASKN